MPAIALYRKLGFIEIPDGRAVKMRGNIKNGIAAIMRNNITTGQPIPPGQAIREQELDYKAYARDHVAISAEGKKT